MLMEWVLELDELAVSDEHIYTNDLKMMREINHQLSNYISKKNKINNKDSFIVTFRSKPIKGIVLELQTIN